MSISVSQNLPEQRLLTEYDYYNDFNYPSLNHDDIIARRNLDSRDFRKRKFKQLDTKRDYSLNNYNLDIPGTIPRRASLYINKPEFNNTNLDIEKSTPTKLFKKLINLILFIQIEILNFLFQEDIMFFKMIDI